ncbi:MAG: DUF1090 domain-containing protein [Ottowia sp.]|uniref:DUF1090 domain-containing protein n=1 Tax=unclassified Ottowia TaxID=2645081 RepID=UPI003C2F15A7
MKHLLWCGLLLSAFTGHAIAAERSAACVAKQSNIEAQLVQAKERGHKREIAGLQKALNANKANCTDESLAKEREKGIRQAQKKVAERERSLAEAERKGDAKKIADRKAKLDAARSELALAEKPIAQ